MTISVRRVVDVRLKQDFSIEGPTMDWFLRKDGRLDEREELATAVRVALGTDRLADASDILPDPDSTWRRGWWGDLEAQEIWNGWDIGTKNWLLTRTKITEAPSAEGSTLDRARQYTEDALQPLIDQRIASHIDVVATRTELHRIEVVATIYRGPLAEIDLRYQLLWEDMAAIDEGDFGVVPIVVDKALYPPRANLVITSALPVSKLSNIPVPGANLLLRTWAPTGVPTLILPANLTLTTTEPLAARGKNRITAQGVLTISTVKPLVPFQIQLQPATANLIMTPAVPPVYTVTVIGSINDFVVAPPSLDVVPIFSVVGEAAGAAAQLSISTRAPSVVMEGALIFNKQPADVRLAITSKAPTVVIQTSTAFVEDESLGAFPLGSSPLGT